MAGLRVVRGKDWKWKDQDGAEGGVGFTIKRDNNPGWLSVLWDNGFSNSYRIGAESSVDLLVLDSATAGTSHPGVVCDNCDEHNVRGIRWKCAVCPDYDLCTECYGNDRHDMNHSFLRIDVPSKRPGVKVGKRASVPKFQAKGIFRGASVVRGREWRWGNQDGGEGTVGKVTKVGFKKEGDDFIYVAVVEWPHVSDKGFIYCLGWDGRVDIKYKTPAVGWGYYKSHLPALKDADSFIEKKDDDGDIGDMLAKLLLAGMTNNMTAFRQLGLSASRKKDRREEVMKRFKPGDLVKMCGDLEQVQQMQKGHGGFNLMMIVALGKVGVVKEVDSDGDVKVAFGDNNWCLNPDLLTKQVVRPTSASPPPPKAQPTNKEIATARDSARAFKVGDRVTLDRDLDFVKRSQQGHGGWNDSMRKAMTNVGSIVEIDEDGDLKVDFEGKRWTLNPDICHKATTTDKPSPKTKNVNKDDNEAMSEDPAYSVGEYVTVDKDVDYVKRKQRGHGGWTDTMKKAMATPGKVIAIDSDGDVKIQIGDKTWTLNPEVLHQATSPSTTDLPKPAKAAPKTAATSKQAQVSAPVASGSSASCNLSVDDQVKLKVTDNALKTLQKGHGGWNPAMQGLKDKVGIVKVVTTEGDVRVKFESGLFLFNPAALLSLDATKNKAYQSSEPLQTDGDNSEIFDPGDQVTIDLEPDLLVMLQEGHGGFTAAMKGAVGSVGRVESVLKSGDVKVSFGSNKWTFNPAVLIKTSYGESHKKSTNENIDNERMSRAEFQCKICLDERINVIFDCGHGCCKSCSNSIKECHLCREKINNRISMFI